MFVPRSEQFSLSFKEQIMSKDKYLSILSPQMEAIVFIILQIFFAGRSFENWGLFNNYSPKWRWLAVDIYRAMKRRGKYPTLATNTEVNSCFSIY